MLSFVRKETYSQLDEHLVISLVGGIKKNWQSGFGLFQLCKTERMNLQYIHLNTKKNQITDDSFRDKLKGLFK